MTTPTNHDTAPAPAAMIEARGLTLALDGRPILRGVSLDLRPGEMVGLIGPNGAGKTTLLKVIGGLWRPTSGAITLNGQPLAAHNPREVARIIASVPQVTHTEFAFSVREIVLMGRSPHLGRFQIEGLHDREVAEKAMRMMGISDLGDRFITALSGGERQRAFIARALAQEPRILLLDEPTANLDVRHQLEVLDLVRGQVHGQGLGVLAAIHDLDLAAEFCDRLILLYQGVVLAQGAPEAVLTPEYLLQAFGVRANQYLDPFTQAMRLSLARSAEPE